MKSILILIGCVLFGTMFLQAQIIYVDAGNSTGIEDGTAAHPFNTIREGIAAASPGNTVFIREGTYTPDESWSGDNHCLNLKAGVKLLGEGAGKSIIEGSVIDHAVSNLSVSLEKISLKEFHFGRGTHAGPFPAPNIIRECNATLIALQNGSGIPVNDTTPGPIYGFLIENNNLGPAGEITLSQGAGVAEIRVVNNTCGLISIRSGAGFTYVIDHNEVHNGIEDNSGVCTTTISNNRILDGPIIDKSGSRQDGLEDQIIENNTITCSDQSPLLIDDPSPAGIIAKSKSVTIRNNIINCTGQVSGIDANAGAPFNVTGNIIVVDEVTEPPADIDEAIWGIKNYSGYGVVTGNSIQGGYIGYYSKAGTVDFSDNIIQKSFIGFLSSGREEVHHNTIKDCHGDGMILNRLTGPLHHNSVLNNAGSGIRVVYTGIDLGGGKDGSPGLNIIQGNGNFDLYIENWPTPTATLYARNNIWDHTDPDEILHYDIYDARGPGGRPDVDFLPLGSLGTVAVEFNTGIRIYPNPAAGKYLVVESDREMEQLQVFSLSGQILLSRGLTGEQQCRIDISGLDAGCLIVAIRERNGISRFFKIARVTGIQ